MLKSQIGDGTDEPYAGGHVHFCKLQSLPSVLSVIGVVGSTTPTKLVGVTII
jgi:hypothetical protein